MKNLFRVWIASLSFVLSAFWWTSSPCAPQFSDWSEPVNLGDVVNSDSNDQHPAVSRDNLSLYFASDRPGGKGGLDIYVSQRTGVDAPWGPPENLGPNINTADVDMAPAFTPDGHWLYFHSGRPGGCGPAGTFDLYVSYRRDRHNDFAWEPAVNLGCVINSEFNDAGPTFFRDHESGTTLLYFTSTRPGGPGDYDIYVSALGEDGSFGPATLVTELSSPLRDTRTALRRDGVEMILSSGRPGGSGSEDLWVSTRDDTEDPWSQPVNLGPVVNSPAFDGAPAFSRDGATVYFFSERPGGFGRRDLYVSTRQKLE